MVRVRTSPSFGTESGNSTRSKSPGFGMPTGRRRSTIWRLTDAGIGLLLPGAGRSARVVAPAVLTGHLVEARLQRGVQRLLGRGQHVVELPGAARSHDR